MQEREYFAKLVEENNVAPAVKLMQDEFNELLESRIVARVAWNNNARRTCIMGL